MPKIAAPTGRQVGIRPVGTPSFSMRAPDASGLARGIAQVESGMIERMEQERERADTAALMDAERQLSEWKFKTMFDPEAGVYTRKGRNALDITNATLPQFDSKVAELEKTLTNDAQRNRWKSIINSQRQSLGSELNRYEFGERQSYYDQVDQGQIAAAVEGASLYYNDPQQVAYYQNKANAVFGAQAQRKGLPAELAEQQRLKVNSAIHSAVAERLLQEDPLKAMAYFTGNRAGMTVDDQLKLSKVLEPMVQRRVGADIADSLLSGGDADYQRYLPAQFQQESGGRQFGPDGKPLTSKAGAVGVAQVMEATGPEAAQLAGLPWDRERWLNDPQYNATLGAAYSRKQFEDFRDPVLALAAYNAGPGRVREVLEKVGDPRTGQVTHEQFLAALPEETQQYVPAILKNSPRSVAAEGSDRYATALKAVQQLPPGEAREAAEARIKSFKESNDAQQRALFDEAADLVKSGGFAALGPRQIADLAADDLVKLKNLDKQLREGIETTTQPGKLDELLNLPAEQLGKLSLEKDIRPYLSKADFKTVQSAWTAARRGDGSVKDRAKAEAESIDRHMAMAGIRVGSSKDALRPDNLARQDKFKAAYNARRESFVATQGREPSLSESEELAGQLLLDVRLSDTGWRDDRLPLWEVTPEQAEQVYIDESDITLESIPVGERASIARELRNNGVAVSEPNIIAAYLDKLSTLGTRIR